MTMQLRMLTAIFLSQVYIGTSSEFPWIIRSCLEKLVQSNMKTGAASTDLISNCLLDLGSNPTHWDHPWIVSLYRGVFEAMLCEEEGWCPKAKRIRREYRLLSDRQRRKYHESIVKLYNDTSVPPNKFMALVLLHRDYHAQVAHGGPPFIIWHRIYLSMFEEALRQFNPDVVLPYWDMTIDQRLDDAALSNIWTSEFVGNGFGKINEGLFSNWSHDKGYVRRYLGESSDLPSEEAIRNILDFPYTDLELVHNNSHAFVGGDMQDPSVSPSDPVFWVLHSFYDLLWQKFIEKNTADGQDILRSYPESNIYPRNRSLALVPLTIGGALRASLFLGKHLYRYAATPRCSATEPASECKSQYLECNLKDLLCQPKSRVCKSNVGPSQETFCSAVNCTSNWTSIDITIKLSFTKENHNCHQSCINAIYLNIYSESQRQRTLIFDEFQIKARVQVMIKKTGLVKDFWVQDGCANVCTCYFLSVGKYRACDKESKTILRDLMENTSIGNNQTLFMFKCYWKESR